MAFQSILFQNPAERPRQEWVSAPEFFVDLNLDQIVAAVSTGREEYNLKPFFHTPLHDIEAIAFRHEIFRDLDGSPLFEDLQAFAQSMRNMRDHLARSEKLRHPHQKQRMFLEAASAYCDGVTGLAHSLSTAEIRSSGLLSFRDYLTRYAASPGFTSLAGQTEELAGEISAISYSILIQSPRVDVRFPAGEPNYSAEVLATFDRFKQGSTPRYKFDFSGSAGVNHIEEQILDRVGQLYQETFAKLALFCQENKEFQDKTIVIFDREIEFYIAYLEHIARYKKAGMHFCYPRITERRAEIFDYQGFDLALAGNLAAENATPVCNDFHLRGPERIIVVSGPNQGGKTTFARTFGQQHYLAGLGCPVPGIRAQLCLFDRMFTHFERGENPANLRGKLQDDLVRVHKVVEAATPRSIIVMNEIFASTTLGDAVVLSKRIAGRIMALDLYCVWVTFLDELATLGARTVSMVSTVVPENPALRTYKIVRQRPDGLAYALSIAEKHRLTYEMIHERIGR